MRQQGRSTGHGTPVSSWLGTSYDAGEIPSVKQKILCQYVNFFRKLRSSPLRKVRLLAKVVGKDMLSVTGRNLAYLHQEFNIDP